MTDVAKTRVYMTTIAALPAIKKCLVVRAHEALTSACRPTNIGFPEDRMAARVDSSRLISDRY